MGVSVQQRVYEGVFDTPKTEASVRAVPRSSVTDAILAAWRAQVKAVKDDDLVFATRSGKPISPNNVLRRWVYLACDELGIELGIRRVNWLVTFMHYDLGYFDDEACRLEPIENPFGPKLLPMSPE